MRCSHDGLWRGPFRTADFGVPAFRDVELKDSPLPGQTDNLEA